MGILYVLWELSRISCKKVVMILSSSFCKRKMLVLLQILKRMCKSEVVINLIILLFLYIVWSCGSAVGRHVIWVIFVAANGAICFCTSFDIKHY
jgi:hypothetical protein